MWSVFLLKRSKLACSEIPGMPGMPVLLPDLARKEPHFPLAVSPKACSIPSYFETSFAQMCWHHHCHDVTPHRVTRDCFALFKTISIHPSDVIRIRQLTITPHLESISIPIKPLTYFWWSFVFEFACSLIEFHCQGDSWLSHSVGLNYILSWSTLNSAEDAKWAGGSTGSIG